MILKESGDNNTSLRIIRVINDTWTVELEIEVSDIALLAQQLIRSDEGRKMAALLHEALKDVEIPVDKDLETMQKAEEERLRTDEREKIYAKAREIGIDLQTLLRKEEERDEPDTGTEAEAQTEA